LIRKKKEGGASRPRSSGKNLDEDFGSFTTAKKGKKGGKKEGTTQYVTEKKGVGCLEKVD